MIIIKHIIRVQCIVCSFFCVFACSHNYDSFNNDIKIITKPRWINGNFDAKKDKFIEISKINIIGNIKDRLILVDDISLSKLKLIIKTNLEDFITKHISLIELETNNKKYYSKIIKNIINNTTTNNKMLNKYIIREETFVDPDTNDLYVMVSLSKQIIKKEFQKQIEIVLKKNKNNKQLVNLLTTLSTNISSNF